MHVFSGALQPNALWNSGKFDRGIRTLKIAHEMGIYRNTSKLSDYTHVISSLKRLYHDLHIICNSFKVLYRIQFRINIADTVYC